MIKVRYKYFLFLLLVLAGCKDTAVTPQQSLTKEQEQLLLGNPSGATTDERKEANNYLMLKTQYALSYSRKRGTPHPSGLAGT